MQPTQIVPAIALAAIIAATARIPATAASRVADTRTSTRRPCAVLRRPASGRRKAVALQTRPHPAIGMPVTRWTKAANSPFQAAVQSRSPLAPQKEEPPERTRTSSIQRNRDQTAESAPSRTSFAHSSGTGAGGVEAGRPEGCSARSLFFDTEGDLATTSTLPTAFSSSERSAGRTNRPSSRVSPSPSESPRRREPRRPDPLHPSRFRLHPGRRVRRESLAGRPPRRAAVGAAAGYLRPRHAADLAAARRIRRPPLVEIAVRPLSPGVNEPFTAVSGVDRLGSALSRLSQREFPSPYRRDGEGALRVIAEATSFPALADASFAEIRRYARSSVAVTFGSWRRSPSSRRPPGASKTAPSFDAAPR